MWSEILYLWEEMCVFVVIFVYVHVGRNTLLSYWYWRTFMWWLWYITPTPTTFLLPFTSLFPSFIPSSLSLPPYFFMFHPIPFSLLLRFSFMFCLLFSCCYNFCVLICFRSLLDLKMSTPPLNQKIKDFQLFSVFK